MSSTIEVPVVTSPVRQSRWQRITPALTLVLAAPLIAEVLPGATRFSSLFVLPIEMCVWGGGALLIRAAVRRWRLGWLNMLLLALALSLAEECLIQQTSLAPLVIKIRGVEYARAFGVNYVYLLWALVYETVFVVFVPVHLVELIFPTRREGVWVSRAGLIVVAALFLLGSFLAWFTWTQIARTKVFHLPAYRPPLPAVVLASAAIITLIVAALGPSGKKLAQPSAPLDPPPPWILGTASAVWAALWYGLVLLAFGIAPGFPPIIAIVAGLLLSASILLLLPRWSAHPHWDRRHTFAVVFGTVLGSMMVSFIGFIGAARADLYFKIIVVALAVVLMILLGLRVARDRTD